MHPVLKLRESRDNTPAAVAKLLAENVEQMFRDAKYPLVKDIPGPEYWEYSENAA